MTGTGADALVGLELHQQLAIGTKLFCACPPVKSEELPYSFERRLRPAQSETGRLDPAAVFEYSKAKSNRYFWSPESSCLVEADEEPPHPMSGEGLDAALIMALALGSKTVEEVHVMRKIVIDGSNTAGFQRTAVVGLGGGFEVGGRRVGVQSVTLEEDAARILGEDASSRHFALDRLGVALVEIALDPVEGDPQQVEAVAQHLGRMLRATGRVARGLGTIRQDLNVSVRGGRVVEVKGVQKLNLLPKVVDYERRRQLGLLDLAAKLRGRGVSALRCRSQEVSPWAGSSSSRVLREGASEGKAAGVVAEGLAGLIGWEPSTGVRLGRELADIARAGGLGGVIHSDEFAKQGVTPEEEARLREDLGAGEGAAIVVVAGPGVLVDSCVPLLVSRLEAVPGGVPAETRAATDAGETRYMRPRPGSQRMYPETDIPDIPIPASRLRALRKEVPEGWEETVARLSKRYTLSRDLALKLYDSDTYEEFARMSGELELEPSLVASTLVDLPPRLLREGVPDTALTMEVLDEVLRAVAEGLAAKEAIPDVLKAVGETGSSVETAIRSLGLSMLADEEIARVVASVVAREKALISERGEAAFSPLMGEVMKELRGKADGAAVGRILKEHLKGGT